MNAPRRETAAIDIYPYAFYDSHTSAIPVERGETDVEGVENTERARRELHRLTEAYTILTEKGFAVDLRKETAAWHAAVLSLGAKAGYRLMSELLCAAYARRFGREYLFTEECLAFEIAYHAEAYFWTQGLAGHTRHLSTLLFSREELVRHCRMIDISVDDVRNPRQRLMFGYERGVRPCWRNTEQDPFDRGRALKRSAPARKRD